MRSLLYPLFRNNFHLYLTILVAWGLHPEVFLWAGQVMHSTGLLFIVLACAVSVVLLEQFSVLSPYRVLPRRSDIIGFILCNVVSGAAAAVVIAKLTQSRSVPHLTATVAWGIVVGLVAYSAHRIVAHMVLTLGFRRRIALNVTPEEHNLIRKAIRTIGLRNREAIDLITMDELSSYVEQNALHELDVMILSSKTAKMLAVDGMWIRAHLGGVRMLDVRDFLAEIPGRIATTQLDDWSFLLHAIPQTGFRRAYDACKVVGEPLLAMVLLVLLAPLMGLIAVGTKLSSPGPILYKQRRCGHLGKTFVLLKFRSMVNDAERSGPQWSGRGDTRVTPFGGFLRRTRLDELPQLINVMRGEMSFVGPRPERPEIYDLLKPNIPLFTLRTLVRPGITGWAQVCAGYASSLEESRTKLEYDLYYVQNLSLRLDIVIVVKTLAVALLGDHTCREADGAPVESVLSTTRLAEGG
jgi:lipopolysaccharide/colanic/teichoic acid biosynthesis glycosyltransferase